VKNAAPLKKKKFLPYWSKRLKHLIKKTLIIVSPSFYWRLRYVVLGYPEPELKLIDKFCSKDLCAVDVGANYGMYTFYASRRFSICHSFEPLPYFETVYKQGFKNQNVEWQQVALSDKKESVTMRTPVCDRGFSTICACNHLEGKVDESDGIGLITVHTYRLDDFDFQAVGFIKVDVEGHEQEVLAGAVQTIRSWKPVILVEVEERHRQDSVLGTTSMLAALGYDCYFLLHKKLLSFNGFKLDVHQNVNRKRDYIRNFFFVHRDNQFADFIKAQAV